MILSIIFTSIIIIAYTSAIIQLIKQRKISQIKSDFINNMTHEFKTPINSIIGLISQIKDDGIENNNENDLISFKIYHQ